MQLESGHLFFFFFTLFPLPGSILYSISHLAAFTRVLSLQMATAKVVFAIMKISFFISATPSVVQIFKKEQIGQFLKV